MAYRTSLRRNQRAKPQKPVNFPEGISCTLNERFNALTFRYIHSFRRSATEELETSVLLSTIENGLGNSLEFQALGDLSELGLWLARRRRAGLYSIRFAAVTEPRPAGLGQR